MNIPYELKLYKRTKNYRAPPELLQIHPLGRSPIVEIYPNGDLNEDPIVLTETGYIMNYLLLHYNKEGKLVPISTKDKELVSYYLYYAEGSLQSTLVSLLVLGKSPKIAPWGFQTITGFVSSAIAKGYFIPELLNQLDFLEGQLAKQPGGILLAQNCRLLI